MTDGAAPAQQAAAEIDEILDARLRVLERNLTRTIEACDATKRDLDFPEYPVDRDAWNRAFKQVRGNAQTTAGRIEDLRTEIEAGEEDPHGAWLRYRVLHGETREVCRTCVELMGGFALRDRMPADQRDRFLDRKICLFTEKLAERCGKLTDPDLNPLLAIPTAEDALSETVTRIIRLRFPEWTMWTLPLVAYEYARVVFADIPQLQQAIEDELTRRLQENPAQEHEREQIRAAITTMMADVFGTYIMGPAYVCAAVLLRLEPLGGGPDVERAETMFAAAQRLYDPDRQDPGRFVRDHVRSTWDATMGLVASGEELEALRKRAERFSRRALRTVMQTTYAEAAFPEYTEEGEHWSRAKALSEAWRAQLQDESRRGPEDEAYELREVLNAAWRCRLLQPDRVSDFARQAREACDAVIGRGERGPKEITHPKSAQGLSGQVGR
jgi:hypothetical protein